MLTAISFAALICVDLVGKKNQEASHLVDAFLDMQIALATAHLSIEESLTGDAPVRLADVEDHFAAALQLTQTLLVGGVTENRQPVAALADERLRARLVAIRAMIEDLRALGRARLADPVAGAIGSPLHRRFHETYRDLRAGLAELELASEQAQLRAQASWRRLFWFIVLTWAGVALAAMVGLLVHDRRRRVAEDALQKANAELQQHSAELDAHRERLSELVETRTAELSRTLQSYEQEIAERRRTEASLRLSENRFRTLVENLPQQVCLKDTQGLYLYCNEEFARDVGIRPEDLVGRTDRELFPAGLADRYQLEDRRILDSGASEEHEERLPRDAGETVIRRIKVPVRNERGEIVGLLTIGRDVTENLKLEAVAEAANLMDNLGFVFAGVRHEIGNPVNAMKMTLAMLDEKVGVVAPEKIRAALEQIRGEVARIEYLLQALKSFNMYESLDLRTVSVSAFMEKLLALVTDDFAKRGIRIDSTVQTDAASGRFDPRALQQVLLNVMSNAADALRGREHPRITIDVARSGDRLRVAVQDNGSGIAEEQQRDLFKPFRTSKSGGTGLGLVIARKMMAKLHGTIEIRSRAGEGTTVVLTLPGGAA